MILNKEGYTELFDKLCNKGHSQIAALVILFTNLAMERADVREAIAEDPSKLTDLVTDIQLLFGPDVTMEQRHEVFVEVMQNVIHGQPNKGNVVRMN